MWRDVVFVNLSGLAPEFSYIARPLRERWAEFEQPIYSGGADSMFTLEVDCNWKLAVENYCEAYHLPFIHPGLNSYSGWKTIIIFLITRFMLGGPNVFKRSWIRGQNFSRL